MRRIDIAAVGVIFLGIFYVATDLFWEQVEGAVFPVVAPAEITEVERSGEFYSTIYGTSERLRECRFVSIEFTFGRGGAGVPYEFLERPKNRPSGEFEFGPWRIGLPPSDIRRSLHSVVTHQCPWRWWKTRTVFYEGGQ